MICLSVKFIITNYQKYLTNRLFYDIISIQIYTQNYVIKIKT